MTTKIAIFKNKEIRKTIHNNEWWFSVSDIVEALTDTPNAKDYIRKMRNRDNTLSEGWGQIVTPLFIETQGGRQKLNCANTVRYVGNSFRRKPLTFSKVFAEIHHPRIQNDRRARQLVVVFQKMKK